MMGNNLHCSELLRYAISSVVKQAEITPIEAAINGCNNLQEERR